MGGGKGRSKNAGLTFRLWKFEDPIPFGANGGDQSGKNGPTEGGDDGLTFRDSLSIVLLSEVRCARGGKLLVRKKKSGIPPLVVSYTSVPGEGKKHGKAEKKK